MFDIQAASAGHSRSPPQVREEQSRRVPKVRRRNRLITSCLECRRRKLKCDKGHPCNNCINGSRSCVFIASSLDADAQAKLAEVKEKMGMLERSLEDNVARQPKAGSITAFAKLPGQDLSCSDQEEDEDTKDLNPSHLVTQDAVYYEDEDEDDLADLGIAMGKVRLNERVGGLVRPRFHEELALVLKDMPQSEHPLSSTVDGQNGSTWPAPSRSHIAPSSSFFFAPGIERTSLMSYLPSKVLVDTLIDHYWTAVHPIARAVHRPSFERQCIKFWACVDHGVQPRISFQAVLFAALLSSVVSMSEQGVLDAFGVDKQSLVNNFREGTEAALAKANFLRTTKLETIQAFVMYLIPLCRDEVSRSHSALTGTLIRLAECMGLHRDPTSYSTSPVEIHVRRLVWYQICFLDIRTCEATGPRPQIRCDDYDTRFPLNIDDIDLDRSEKGENGVDVSNDRMHFTDMTITRIRFECYEMHRFLWNEQPKLDRKRANGEHRVTIASLMRRVHSFKAAMEKTYVPMLSNRQPLHALATEIYGILSDRLYISLLHKYTSRDPNKLPLRLQQLVMSASVMIIERSMTIEQQPALSPWAWYVGALHQYHTALLLLSQLYIRPPEPALEQRVWRCLDFAFDVPSEAPIPQKARKVLEALIEKTSLYTSLKKVRAPNNMPHVGFSSSSSASGARKEGRGKRRTSASLHSTTNSISAATGSVDTASSSIVQHKSFSEQCFQQHQERQNEEATAFPELVPKTDWDTVALPACPTMFQQARQPQQQPQPLKLSPELHENNNLAFTPIQEKFLSPNTIGNVNQQHGSNVGRLGSVAHSAVTAKSSGSSPMDALSEIDWNEIEQMLGGPELSMGSILIPPFTFPQSSATDL